MARLAGDVAQGAGRLVFPVMDEDLFAEGFGPGIAGRHEGRVRLAVEGHEHVLAVLALTPLGSVPGPLGQVLGALLGGRGGLPGGLDRALELAGDQALVDRIAGDQRVVAQDQLGLAVAGDGGLMVAFSHGRVPQCVRSLGGDAGLGAAHQLAVHLVSEDVGGDGHAIAEQGFHLLEAFARLGVGRIDRDRVGVFSQGTFEVGPLEQGVALFDGPSAQDGALLDLDLERCGVIGQLLVLDARGDRGGLDPR